MVPPARITSRQNAHVKDAVRLRIGRERRRRQRFLIYGAREIERAIASGIRLLQVFICEELCNPRDKRPLAGLGTSQAELLHVSPDVYSKLAFGDRDDGIVVVAETPRR